MNKIFLLLLLTVPLAANAQIYRCEGEDGPWYSQLPCAEDAAEIVLEDQRMFSETPQVGALSPRPNESPEAVRKTPADTLSDFVANLSKQRVEQLDSLDQEIIDLEARLNSEESLPSEEERASLVKELALSYASRNSISEQYDSMIMEAQKRVDELAAGVSSQ